MNIALAQIKPNAVDLSFNLNKHLEFIEIAIHNNADWVIFPELSITGYEPSKAETFQFSKVMMNEFQKYANQGICISVGAPTQTINGISISAINFYPNSEHKTYYKQYLHSDELPHFVPEKNEKNLLSETLGFAICYESSLDEHLNATINHGATFYIASTAKDKDGVSNTFERFPKISSKHNIQTFLVNSVGKQDNFTAYGNTAAWNRKGELIAKLNETEEGILLINTETNSYNKFA